MKNQIPQAAAQWLTSPAYLWIWLIALLPAASWAQTQTIALTDEATGQPVAYAYYRYGQEKGDSGAQGQITLSLNNHDTLFLSHLEYGKKRFLPAALQVAKSSGKLMLPQAEVILQPVTVLAIRQPQVGEGQVTLSDRDQLAHDAGAFLNSIPAINAIRKSGSYGFDPVMRGFKYDQLNIVIDGAQGAVAACPNRMDPPVSQISLNQMEKVEVIKGPYNLRFGPTVGGTVNFISQSPVFDAEKPLKGRFSSSYESNGNVFRNEGLLGFSGENYQVSINGSWSTGDDYNDGNGQEVASSFSRASFGMNAAFRLAPNQALSLAATKNVARDVDFPALPMDLRTDDTWLFNARHSILPQKGAVASIITTAYATLVDHSMDNLTRNLDPRTVNAQTFAETETFGGRSEARVSIGETSWAFVGADVKVERARGSRTREMLMGPMAGNILRDNAWQNAQISRVGAFAEYHATAGKTHFIFSGRLDVNEATVRDGADEFMANYAETSITQVNPSASLGITRSVGEGVTAGFWLGRGARSGSITERYINYFPVGLDPYELLGNPDLAPEINNQADLKLNLEKGSVQLQANVFAGVVHDFISSAIREELSPRLPMSPGVRQFINIEAAFLAGGELMWSQLLPLGLQSTLQVAYTYGQDLERDDALPEIAPLDFRAGLQRAFLQNKLVPSVTFRHVAAQQRTAELFGETDTPAFNTVDFQASYRFKVWNFTAGVQNIFDVAYYEHLARSVRAPGAPPIFSPGRNVYLTLRVDLM